MNGIVQQQQQAQQQPDIPSAADLPAVVTSSAALILDTSSLDNMERMAKMMASGKSTIPKHLIGSVGDCLAVVMQAMQWKMNPFAVAQKTHFVNGQIGYEGQLINAAIVTSGVIEGRPEYEWFGPWEKVIGKFEIRKSKDKDSEYRVPGWSLKDEEGIGIIIRATIKGEVIPRELTLLLAQARVRNSQLWADDPRQQLAYLAIKRWARLYTPDVIMGVYSPDELETAQPMKDITDNDPLPKNAKPQDYANRKRKNEPEGPSEELLRAARGAADKGRDAFGLFWKGLQPKDRGALRNEINDLQDRVAKAEQNRTVDMPTTSQAPAAEAGQQQQAGEVSQADVDEFTRQMDAASGKAGDDYAGGYVPS